MSTVERLARYYAARAAEYEDVYRIPERQGDIARLKARLCELLADHHVLEVACGTGYWTAAIAPCAASIVATDINEEVLAIARQKPVPAGRVRFLRDDAYDLTAVGGGFSAGFAGFWWSHVPRSRLKAFLERFHARLAPGALVVFADNVYIEGVSHPTVRVDGEGNGYQRRRLSSCATYEVLKNYPDEAELREVLAGLSAGLCYERSRYYWCLSYTVGGDHAQANEQGRPA